MKPNNQIFHTNFPEDKMTESVKLADYRGNPSEAHLHQFEKYARGALANHDNNDPLQYRDDKQYPREDVDLAGNARQIKTEYSLVSQIESGFQKPKANQAEMLKQLRSQYDHLKNLPLDRQKQGSHSSNSASHRQETSEVASSIATSKPRNRNRDIEINREFGQRQERIWTVEKRQYEMIVANCQTKIEQLLHAEMEYKRNIHELRSSIITPKVVSENKGSQLLIKQLQNSLRQEKQKSKYLEIQFDKSKKTCRQLTEKTIRLQSEFSSRSRDNYQAEEEKKKLEDMIRLEKQKFQNSEIEKRKHQMEFQIFRKDKDMEINRLLRQMEHEKIVSEMNFKNSINKFEEEISLKDKRYKLLLEEYEKLKRQSHDKRDKREASHDGSTFALFDEIKKLIQKNKNAHNEEFSRNMHFLISKMEEQGREDPGKDLEFENQRLMTEIKVLNNQISYLNQRQTQVPSVLPASGSSQQIEKIRNFYEAEITELKSSIEILKNKLKQKPAKIQIPSMPSSPAHSNNEGESLAVLKRRISELEIDVNQARIAASQNEKLYMLYKGKWENDEKQLRAMKRQFDQVSFELEKTRKEFASQMSMERLKMQTTQRILKADLQKAQGNAGHWMKEFQQMKNFYEQKIQEKNKLIEAASSVSEEEIRKQYSRSLEIAKSEYQRQIRALTEKVADHPSSSLEYEGLRKKHAHLEMMYSDLKNNSRKAWQMSEGVDHLWTVKETQYGNVNKIMRQVQERQIPEYGHYEVVDDHKYVVRPAPYSGGYASSYSGVPLPYSGSYNTQSPIMYSQQGIPNGNQAGFRVREASGYNSYVEPVQEQPVQQVEYGQMENRRSSRPLGMQSRVEGYRESRVRQESSQLVYT